MFVFFVIWAFLSSITNIVIPAFIANNLPVIISLLAFAAVIGFVVSDRNAGSAPKKEDKAQNCGMARWLMKQFGVKDEHTANIILVTFSVCALLLSLYFFL